MNTLGIILAGGRSSRLYPATIAATKQLLPVYDKPLIYYPLSTLMLLGIRNYVIITTPEERTTFEKLFWNTGWEFGIDVTFAVQAEPKGIADAFNVIKSAIDVSEYDKSVLILGDNIFYGSYMSKLFSDLSTSPDAGIVLKRIQGREAHRFGIAEWEEGTSVIENIIEKPTEPMDGWVDMVTGLYFFPSDVYSKVSKIQPSARGELEITDLINLYAKEDRLDYAELLRGMILYDTGTPDSLNDASNFIRGLQAQGTMVGSPHEIAYNNKWIARDQLLDSCNKFSKSEYGAYLKELVI